MGCNCSGSAATRARRGARGSDAVTAPRCSNSHRSAGARSRMSPRNPGSRAAVLTPPARGSQSRSTPESSRSGSGSIRKSEPMPAPARRMSYRAPHTSQTSAVPSRAARPSSRRTPDTTRHTRRTRPGSAISTLSSQTRVFSTLPSSMCVARAASVTQSPEGWRQHGRGPRGTGRRHHRQRDAARRSAEGRRLRVLGFDHFDRRNVGCRLVDRLLDGKFQRDRRGRAPLAVALEPDAHDVAGDAEEFDATAVGSHVWAHRLERRLDASSQVQGMQPVQQQHAS